MVASENCALDAVGEGIREYVNYLSVELLKRIVFASTGLRVPLYH